MVAPEPAFLVSFSTQEPQERAFREYLQQCYHYLKETEGVGSILDAAPPSQVKNK